ncbi:MAG: endolytic transglycosylase MltG [Patescibacteria group bacterium]|jgi:UPF0755 protein
MPEELDPQKYHVLSPKKKRAVFVLLAAMVFLVLPPLLYIYYDFAINRPSQTEDEVTIQINKGESVYDIAGILYDHDVLNSKYLFTLYVLATNKDKNIQAGVYMVPPGMSIVELADLLQYGTNDQKVTLLEGWRVEEYARLLSKTFGDVDYEAFVSYAKPSEGFLFPDTYEFRYDSKEKDIVEAMKSNFEAKTAGLFGAEVLDSLGLTQKEVVILASIVEREVRDKSDKAVVAGILTKRYKQGMTLGADATTQYMAALLRVGCEMASDGICPSDNLEEGVDWWPNDLTQEEIAYDNPFNTRKVVGLPPEPICNPGLESIGAVVKSVPTQYNYYLTDKDGITHYAVTLEEHNSNIYTYLR